MIFLANIGNTNITYGFYREKITASDFCPARKLLSQRDFECFFNSAIKKYGLTASQIAGAVISSVVPQKTQMLLSTVRKNISSEPLFISKQTNWEFDTSSYSGILGTDRLLCCLAAMKKYQPPFIVVDFGTATTINVIDRSGSFTGGVILPGVLTGLQALTEKTSQIDFECLFSPKSVIGKSTNECLMAGATYGTAAMIEGLIKRIEHELGDIANVIVTGGNAKKVMPYFDFKINYEPNLLLEGLAAEFSRQV